jgi:hypothetical protein
MIEVLLSFVVACVLLEAVLWCKRFLNGQWYVNRLFLIMKNNPNVWDVLWLLLECG